ncbi:MAG: YlxR family protein [Bacillota bacterium]
MQVSSIKKCAGCGDHRSEEELMRIVNNKGEIKVDPGGVMSGRDVYICPQVRCLEAAVENNELSKALKVKIEDDIYQKLLEEINHG